MLNSPCQLSCKRLFLLCAKYQTGGTLFGHEIIQKAVEASEAAGLAAFAKLATASYEALENDLQARIETLEAQALRFATVIDNISQGICFFDADERLILSNRRYAEIYRIAPEQLQPGLALSEIVERRVAAGTSAMATDAFSHWPGR